MRRHVESGALSCPMVWWKGDDDWWSNPKLRRAGRSARGLFADIIAYCSKQNTGADGWMPAGCLDMVGASPTDPDLKALVKAGLLHRRGDDCKCTRLNREDGWTYPAERGFLIHDFLDYNPTKEESDVAKEQKAERKDPVLRAEVRARDFGRCRYCTVKVGPPSDRRSPISENLDHVNPEIANGAANVVIACKSCNSRKKRRTPEQAQMPVIDLDVIRAKHYAELGIPDPEPHANPTRNQNSGFGPHGAAPGTGRDGSGPGRDGTGRVGRPPEPHAQRRSRGSAHPNPYTRAGHADPALEPPPPQPDLTPPPAPPPLARPSRRARNPKGRKRR